MASTSNVNKDEAFLRSRVEDTVRLSEKRHYAAFLGFLDEREQTQAEQILRRSYVTNYRFFGGYDDGERRVLGVFPDGEEPDESAFPLRAVAFHYRTDSRLSHRDVLGTLMACGLRRDAVGDILCADGLAVVFLRDELCSFVCDQVQRIGGESVSAEDYYSGELPIAHAFTEIRDTVASARLDAVLSALIRCSREQSAQLIRTDAVSVDHTVIRSVSHAVDVLQKVSVRGHGKFIIDELGPETKKGRLRFVARKYI